MRRPTGTTWRRLAVIAVSAVCVGYAPIAMTELWPYAPPRSVSGSWPPWSHRGTWPTRWPPGSGRTATASSRWWRLHRAALCLAPVLSAGAAPLFERSPGLDGLTASAAGATPAPGRPAAHLAEPVS
ncbi:hypothetical protein [Streptomyces sp. NPDC058751]|uniref:hypothetical protein n=1 Tax=Streptomyces sp. NPDC058751 TaxID=3346623 RepID=UPI0036C0C6FD